MAIIQCTAIILMTGIIFAIFIVKSLICVVFILLLIDYILLILIDNGDVLVYGHHVILVTGSNLLLCGLVEIITGIICRIIFKGWKSWAQFFPIWV